MEEILRYGQGNSRPMVRECRVRHNVVFKRFHECDARILATTAAVGPQLIISFRLQGDTEPLHASRIADSIEEHSYNPDARVISLRDHPRKEV